MSGNEQAASAFNECTRSALLTNVRSIPRFGYRIGSDGTLLPIPLSGHNGAAKLKGSPLWTRLALRYPKSISIKRKSLLGMNGEWWDRLEHSLQAVGYTILSLPYVPNILKDVGVLEAWEEFKLFFINLFLQRAHQIKVFDRKKKREVKVWTYPNALRALQALKSLAAWARWYAAGDSSNPKPKLFPEFMGYDPSGYMTLSWFGGCLSHLCRPLSGDLSKETVYQLCQIGTFGRALPPAFGKALSDAAEETIGILSTPFEVDSDTKAAFRFCAKDLGSRLPKIGLTSHLSLAKTGSFFVPSEEGGKASEIVRVFKPWLRSAVRDIIDNGHLFVEAMYPKNFSRDYVCWYDCFGRVILRFRKKPYFRSMSASLPGLRPVNFDPPNPWKISFGPASYPVDQAILERLLITRMQMNPSWIADVEFTEILGFWPDSEDFNTLLASDTSEIWLNSVLGYFIEAYCLAEVVAGGLMRFSRPPDLIFGNVTGTLGGMVGLPIWYTDEGSRLTPLAPLPVMMRTLAEPGLKPRPLTKSVAVVSALQQLLRFMVEPALHDDPRARIGFEAAHAMWETTKQFNKLLKKRKGDFIIVNADYKSSTDLIPLDLLEEMWKGFWEGQNLPENHPIHVLWSLVTHRRMIHPGDAVTTEAFKKVLGSDRPVLQERGSFMGEPISFMTLTVYNLCVVSISRSWAMYYTPTMSASCLYGVSRALDLCQVVGDDVLLFCSRGTYQCFLETVRRTGMKLSDGKNLVSNRISILCEETAYYDRETRTLSYQDVIKVRLLTASTRLYSDNRSSVIGKGQTFSKLADWFPDAEARGRSKAIFMSTFRKTLTNKLFLPSSFPIELPHIVSGINIPSRTWDQFERESSFVLRFLQWVLESPFFDFAYWLTLFKQTNSRVAKGVDGSLSPEEVSKVLRGFREESNLDEIPGGDFTRPIGHPQRMVFDSQKDRVSNVIFRRNSVMSGLRDRGIEIPLSPYTGQPVQHVLVSLAKTHLGMVPMMKVIDLAERAKIFSLLFADDVGTPVEKLSFAKYQRRLHKLWKRQIGGLESRGEFHRSGRPLPARHQFRGFDDLSRKFAIRMNNWVFADSVALVALQRGPSLAVNYKSLTRRH